MKIGVVGTGHLGKIHLKCLNLIKEWDLVGFYEVNEAVRDRVSSEFGLVAFTSLDELLENCEAVDIVTPTTDHFQVAQKAILSGCHVFVEKPVTSTSTEAEMIQVMLRKKPNLKFQVGHVERFNPAFLPLKNFDLNPKFIEVHRLANFNPRGTDVSVVHDLMIHDLDLVAHLVSSPVKEVRANGVNIVSSTADICNARIEFENGCVANVTASRISINPMRKMRIFQGDAYVSIDFLDKKIELITLKDQEDKNKFQMPLDTQKGKKWIEVEHPDIEEVNAIKEELTSFYFSIKNKTREEVNLEDAIKALKLVESIDRQTTILTQ